MDIKPFLKLARTRSSNAILTMLRLGFAEDGAIVSVRATDLEQYLTAAKPGATECGAALVAAASVPKGAPDIGTWRVVGERCRIGPASVVASPAADDFPPDLERAECGASLPAGAWSAMVDRVGYAVPSDDQRYGLNGYHLERVNEDGQLDKCGPVLRAVSTDGSRLAWLDLPLAGELAMPSKFLLPRAFPGFVAALVNGEARCGAAGGPNGDGPARFAVAGESGGWRVRAECRLTDGEFPAYRSVLPKVGSTATVARNDLLAILAACEPCALDQASTTRFYMADGWLTGYARAVDVGEASARSRAELEDGCPRVVGLNLRYFRQAVSALPAGCSVRLGFRWPTDPETGEPCMTGEYLSPIVVLSTEAPDTHAVVMPIRLDLGAGAPVPAAPEVTAKPAAKPARKASARKAAEPAPTAPATAEPAPTAELQAARAEAARLLTELRTERAGRAADMEKARTERERLIRCANEATDPIRAARDEASRYQRLAEQALEQVRIARELHAGRATGSAPAAPAYPDVRAELAATRNALAAAQAAPIPPAYPDLRAELEATRAELTMGEKARDSLRVEARDARLEAQAARATLADTRAQGERDQVRTESYLAAECEAIRERAAVQVAGAQQAHAEVLARMSAGWRADRGRLADALRQLARYELAIRTRPDGDRLTVVA